MRIRAKFIGNDPRLVTGLNYQFYISERGSVRLVIDLGSDVPGYAVDYESISAFLRNWNNINHFPAMAIGGFTAEEFADGLRRVSQEMNKAVEIVDKPFQLLQKAHVLVTKFITALAFSSYELQLNTDELNAKLSVKRTDIEDLSALKKDLDEMFKVEPINYDTIKEIL